MTDSHDPSTPHPHSHDPPPLRRSRSGLFSHEHTAGAFAPLPHLPRSLNRKHKPANGALPTMFAPQADEEDMMDGEREVDDGGVDVVADDEFAVPFPSVGALALALPSSHEAPAALQQLPQPDADEERWPRPPSPLPLLRRKSEPPTRVVSHASGLSSLTPPYTPITLKDGRPLKPSLKSPTPSSTNVNAAASGGAATPGHTRAVSAPATPGYLHKNVHFAAKKEGLERVVHFLREQRPIAVSHGTPETDTETDTDSREYPFPRMPSPAQQSDHRIQLDPARTSLVPNPAWLVVRHEHARSPVMLESLLLPSARPLVLRGTLLVRNVAFAKHVAVRFTLDDWQTVSEVSGAHVNHLPSLPPPFAPRSPFAAPDDDPGWDRFGFRVQLEDYARKLEERTVYLAARYRSDGQEWWDNNSGANYCLRFVRAPEMAASALSTAPSSLPRAPPPTPASPSFNSDPVVGRTRRSSSFGQLSLKLLNYAMPTSPPQATHPLTQDPEHPHPAEEDGAALPGEKVLTLTLPSAEFDDGQPKTTFPQPTAEEEEEEPPTPKAKVFSLETLTPPSSSESSPDLPDAALQALLKTCAFMDGAGVPVETPMAEG